MNSKHKETYESLVLKHGCKIIPLSEAMVYAGIDTLKTATRKAVNFDLPFPAFRTGYRNGWYVNAWRLAEFLDNKDREYTELFNYKNSPGTISRVR